jgi:hypothetical protein
MPRTLSIVFAIALLTCVGGCGEAEEHGAGATADDVVVQKPAPAAAEGEQTEPEETVSPAECPPEAGAGCRAAEGRIVYVEAIDPDGDGDAHFVIADGGSITLPGLTAIDVRRGLRPRPLPGTGDLISAAGPVQTGSYGQRQIHALVLNVARPAR